MEQFCIAKRNLRVDNLGETFAIDRI